MQTNGFTHTINRRSKLHILIYVNGCLDVAPKPHKLNGAAQGFGWLWVIYPSHRCKPVGDCVDMMSSSFPLAAFLRRKTADDRL